jgi:hypothetical protein
MEDIVTLKFAHSKSTKNTNKFDEVGVPKDQRPKAGSIYLVKELSDGLTELEVVIRGQ